MTKSDSKVSVFDTTVHKDTVEAMRIRREAVSAKGESFFTEHGSLHPLVEVKGTMRVSHNSLEPVDGGKFRLTNGIALPNLYWFDGTGSVGEKVEEVFKALGQINDMTAAFRTRYNMQMATAVLQDIHDTHGAVAHTQFETDNKIAEQMRLLIPDLNGYDHIEEYNLALLFSLLASDLDITRMYGLKGHMRIIGDEEGYESVPVAHAKEFIGHTIQAEMTPKEICKQLLAQWMPVYINIGSHGESPRHDVTDWWQDKLGDRVVEVPDMDILAEVLVGTTYVLETAKPTKDGLAALLRAEGSNKKMSASSITNVWNTLQPIEGLFGEQTKLPGFDSIPMPGTIFSNMRFAWPDGDPRAEGQIVFPEAAKTPKDLKKAAHAVWSSKKF